MPPPIRVLIVDDHPMVRDGIAALLDRQPDMEPVGEATDGAEAIEKFRALSPDLTLMDVQMANELGGYADVLSSGHGPVEGPKFC